MHTFDTMLIFFFSLYFKPNSKNLVLKLFFFILSVVNNVKTHTTQCLDSREGAQCSCRNNNNSRVASPQCTLWPDADENQPDICAMLIGGRPNEAPPFAHCLLELAQSLHRELERKKINARQICLHRWFICQENKKSFKVGVLVVMFMVVVFFVLLLLLLLLLLCLFGGQVHLQV